MDDATAWDTALTRGVRFAPATNCSTLEIDFSESVSQPDYVVGTVTDDTILDWLQQVSLVVLCRLLYQIS